MSVRSACLLGTLAGALLYLAAIAFDGCGLQQNCGCTVGGSFALTNAPARALGTLVPNRTIAPRNSGEGTPPPDPAWSPWIFATWGAACFGAGGMLVALTLRGLLGRVRRGSDP